MTTFHSSCPACATMPNGCAQHTLMLRHAEASALSADWRPIEGYERRLGDYWLRILHIEPPASHMRGMLWRWRIARNYGEDSSYGGRAETLGQAAARVEAEAARLTEQNRPHCRRRGCQGYATKSGLCADCYRGG